MPSVVQPLFSLRFSGKPHPFSSRPDHLSAVDVERDLCDKPRVADATIAQPIEGQSNPASIGQIDASIGGKTATENAGQSSSRGHGLLQALMRPSETILSNCSRAPSKPGRILLGLRMIFPLLPLLEPQLQGLTHQRLPVLGGAPPAIFSDGEEEPTVSPSMKLYFIIALAPNLGASRPCPTLACHARPIRTLPGPVLSYQAGACLSPARLAGFWLLIFQHLKPHHVKPAIARAEIPHADQPSRSRDHLIRGRREQYTRAN